MKLYTIGDLHFSQSADKPMDIFGKSWEGHTQKIIANWQSIINDDDIVVVCGDVCWKKRKTGAFFCAPVL